MPIPASSIAEGQPKVPPKVDRIQGFKKHQMTSIASAGNLFQHFIEDFESQVSLRFNLQTGLRVHICPDDLTS